MILNCACLVDPQSSKLIRAISEEISSMTHSKNALAFIPHFSIRNDFEIPEEHIPSLQKDAQQLVTNYKSIQLNITRYGFYPWRIIYLDIPTDKTLGHLHTDLMQTIQKYRTSWVADNLLSSPHFHGKQKAYIVNYGYQFSFEYYSPHFTVAGNDMSQQDFERAKNYLKDKTENITVTVSSVVFMDRENGNASIINANLR